MKFLEDGLRFYQDKLDLLDKKFQLSGEYNGTSEKITSTCLVCGYSWESLPYNLIKNGCPCCNKKVKGSFESFVAVLKQQGREITVVPSEYKNRNSKFTFICNVCNHTWITTAGSLLYQKSGCPCCALDTWLTMETVQERLDQKGKTITVSGEYESYRSKVACSCNVCGLNWKAQIPILLCTPTGCPTCAKTGFDPNKPGYLYYLRVSGDGQTYWKIGITNLSVRKRFKKSDRDKITTLYCHKFENGLDAYNAEQNVLKMYKEYRAPSVNILKTGNTELFTKDVLQMDHLFWGPI